MSEPPSESKKRPADERDYAAELAQVNRELQELREQQLLADRDHELRRLRRLQLIEDLSHKRDAAEAHLDAADEERAAKAARSVKTGKPDWAMDNGKEEDLWILQKERIKAFWEFKIPQGWSDDQRVAFEKCRKESKQLCSRRLGNDSFFSSFCKWHDEYRSEILSDDTTRYVQHEWLAENPLYRVYWQWLKDGIPADV